MSSIFSKIKAWFKRKLGAFFNSPASIFVIAPLFFIVFFIALLLFAIMKTLEALFILPIATKGRAIFVILNKSPAWVSKYHDSLHCYRDEGFSVDDGNHPVIDKLDGMDSDDGSLIKIEFEPTIADAERIKKGLEFDGLEVVIRESKITPAHRRFLFWTLETGK